MRNTVMNLPRIALLRLILFILKDFSVVAPLGILLGLLPIVFLVGVLRLFLLLHFRFKQRQTLVGQINIILGRFLV
jgi:hypothetical protein